MNGAHGQMQLWALEARTITNLSDDQLVESVDHQLDEWSEHAKDYCSGTGTKV